VIAYRNFQVHDAFCKGVVETDGSTYSVKYFSRPSLHFVSAHPIDASKSEGMLSKAAVCQGVKDFLDLELSGMFWSLFTPGCNEVPSIGRPPFSVNYDVSFAPLDIEQNVLISHHTFSSIQARHRLPLDTSSPGKRTYTLKQIGDATYPITGEQVHRQIGLPLRVTQDIISRPRAYFLSSIQLTFCLHENFHPQNREIDAGTIILEGLPPFYVELSLQSLATGEIREDRVQIWESSWKASIPDFKFDTVGTYLLIIKNVFDNSECVEAIDQQPARSLLITVAETAALVPYETKSEFCVGDMLKFQLEGKPPWEIR
jgi:nucleoporin POM152